MGGLPNSQNRVSRIPDGHFLATKAALGTPGFDRRASWIPDLASGEVVLWLPRLGYSWSVHVFLNFSIVWGLRQESSLSQFNWLDWPSCHLNLELEKQIAGMFLWEALRSHWEWNFREVVITFPPIQHVVALALRCLSHGRSGIVGLIPVCKI